VVGAAILLLPFGLVTSWTWDEERLPVAAAARLEDVRTFHDDLSGGYLIFDQTLTEGVFIDDRAELYRDRIQEYVEVREGRRDWREVFERDGIEQALLREGEPLVGWLEDAGWSASYRDDYFVIMRP
jgi:hypothetical protein